MTDRPILFSATMVRAILDGTKTQTRRIVKGVALEWLDRDGFTPDFIAAPENRLCPYGQPGDQLWVREHWATDAHYDGIPPRELPPAYAVRYLADGAVRGGIGQADGKDRRAFHMPRWASRISLEITRVRVERLQDISEEDAEAEGIDFMRRIPDADETLLARDLYECLWDAINGPGSWAANPWVWVVEFTRTK